MMTLGLDSLAEIASDVAASQLWVPHAYVDRARRHHVRLLVAETYEAWLLGWAPGQHVGVHDHGGAAGTFVVVEGVLTEERPRARRGTRRLSAGDIGAVPPHRLHDVGNRSAGGALSVHIYSPPLTTMTFYDATGRAPVRTEEVAPVAGGVLSRARG